jgi:2-amino-4-hydroxy-6-hydroxymethyldihydropteridine diphosphokinase
MDKPQKAYISLGSNKGDKFKNLQDAIDDIHLKIGQIKLISRVYKSPAFGFEGDEFLNTCLILETQLPPKKVMQELLSIEKALGRTRNKKKEYQSRLIDLDIIFFEDKIINTKTLKVPHPEMHKRKFVLQPLFDIASKLMHPNQNKEIAVLLEECEDQTVLEPINNIGAGKTSLATKMSHDFNAKLILERFADNPFLPKFYEEPQRYAFTLEMSFLADRYQQISDDLSQLDLFKDFIISDYDVFKSLISKITLPEDEFKLYRKLFYLMYRDIAKPDLYVYLYQNTERLQENIKRRGRDFEQNINDEYLEKINAGYLEFLKSQAEFNVKIIDISDKDFVLNREDYLWILDEVCRE